ncbi:rRNA maturation RNase YbeY [soil metagenome]
MPVIFNKESTNFRLKDARLLKQWIKLIVEEKNSILGDVAYVFCSDEFLLQMNQQHLKHDFYTDIITFDYTEGGIVSGDLFISIDRVRENAKTNAVSFTQELHRVMIHGILHLLGLKDKKKSDQKAMRLAENQSLKSLESLIVPRGTIQTKKLKK